jgi:hypothetical protein
MTLTCPCCHAKYPLDAALEGEAAGELQLLLAQAGPLARPLVAYLGMFRSKTRALSFDRAVKLAREVLELGADPRALVTGLVETVEALRRKRDQGDIRPLKDHRYLSSVLQSVGAVAAVPAPAIDFDAVPGLGTAVKGKRRQAVDLLGEWGATSRLRQAIAIGLIGLVAIGRPGTPAADMVQANADLWLHLLTKQGLVECDEDIDRVYKAFSSLVQQSMKDYPEPAAILPHLPRRKPQDRIAEPEPSAEQRAAALAAAAVARQAVERM